MKLRAVLLALAITLSATSVAWPKVITPLVVGWEQFFKLDWQPAVRRGRPIVAGHILNDWGMPAASIQLLVDALDERGAVLGQRVEWLGTGLTPGMRAYFEVPAPAPAPTYRVSVYAFQWVQTQGGGDRF
jgi:hypothetical protein